MASPGSGEAAGRPPILGLEGEPHAFLPPPGARFQSLPKVPPPLVFSMRPSVSFVLLFKSARTCPLSLPPLLPSPSGPSPGYRALRVQPWPLLWVSLSPLSTVRIPLRCLCPCQGEKAEEALVNSKHWTSLPSAVYLY